jgi:intraflagellar transport protein 88
LDSAPQSVQTSSGRNAFGPGSANRPLMSSMGRNVPGTAQRLTTGQAGGGGGDARPMTSVSGAGFQSAAKQQAASNFDPLQIGKGPAAPLAEKSENSSEEKAKEMEKTVHRLIEASAEALSQKDTRTALEKAKEAGKAERNLCKFRESKNLTDQINLELTYAICFNLANCYYHSKMYDEALRTYNLVVKNKAYPQSGRLRVNMGNIYYDQKKYPMAIKMYRMALDQIPTTGKELRFRIFRNIGNSFIKMGQFQDAVESFETVMAGSPDMQTAFNLLLCYYARGDREKMRRHFNKMVTISVPGLTDEDEEKFNNGDVEEYDHANDRQDLLREEMQKRLETHHERLLTSARLTAPLVEEDDEKWIEGYRWVMDQLRQDYESVASKLEIDVAMTYMKKRQFDEALEVLKSFERKDQALRAIAASNLSFIYFLEGEYEQAEKEADVAMRSDRYNAKALVNKGNCLFVAGNYQGARDMYLEAVGVEADCVEAIYNLGLTNIRIGALDQAHHAFDKLHTVLPSLPEALFQLGAIYERGGSTADMEQAAKTYEMLLSKAPGDPNLCSRLGLVYEKLEDDSTACHWHTEAHRYSPVNLNVISWLGVWYVKREMYEQAIDFFSRAAAVQPGEVKWQLMVTSCYRRLGNYNTALELYQEIHEKHPENVEALQYLEALCRDLGRPHDEYSRKLEKLRRSMPQQNTMQGGMTRPGGGSATQQPAPVQRGKLRVDRPDRPSRQEQPIAEEKQQSEQSRSPMTAPQARAGAQARPDEAPKSAKVDDDDDFGDMDVSNLLV